MCLQSLIYFYHQHPALLDSTFCVPLYADCSRQEAFANAPDLLCWLKPSPLRYNSHTHAAPVCGARVHAELSIDRAHSPEKQPLEGLIEADVEERVDAAVRVPHADGYVVGVGERFARLLHPEVDQLEDVMKKARQMATAIRVTFLVRTLKLRGGSGATLVDMCWRILKNTRQMTARGMAKARKNW
ncbi:hypothetical protein EYF80_041284 [Liparis tanakae]|uniref:Uncharacterized protein n=1 Tax=Liparis tanakae TaxID=230148 RepID=A0A4Z2G4J0_9TELE|nr:hypothetical protein EYF80_041284 [Liparis tanakae]